MDRPDGADRTLPVTAEIGGEGGSYADATTQRDTFKGPAGNERVDPKLAGLGAEAPAIRSGEDQSDPKDDVVTYPTERPNSE